MIVPESTLAQGCGEWPGNYTSLCSSPGEICKPGKLYNPPFPSVFHL